MAETANLLLPFLAEGQAQKHLTVNEAFERLDVLLLLSARSRTLAVPPASTAEGARWIVPAGASGAWSGRDGQIAAFLNGGWRFFQPRSGWRAFVEDEGSDAVFAAGVWTTQAGGGSGGAGGALSVLEFDHALAPGGAQDTMGTIPAGAQVFGVTARVLETVTGAAGWSLGVGAAHQRYGSGLPTAAGAAVTGAVGAPLAYRTALPLRLTPEGGGFAEGRLRLAIHYLSLAAPAA